MGALSTRLTSAPKSLPRRRENPWRKRLQEILLGSTPLVLALRCDRRQRVLTREEREGSNTTAPQSHKPQAAPKYSNRSGPLTRDTGPGAEAEDRSRAPWPYEPVAEV